MNSVPCTHGLGPAPPLFPQPNAVAGCRIFGEKYLPDSEYDSELAAFVRNTHQFVSRPKSLAQLTCVADRLTLSQIRNQTDLNRLRKVRELVRAELSIHFLAY